MNLNKEDILHFSGLGSGSRSSFKNAAQHVPAIGTTGNQTMGGYREYIVHTTAAHTSVLAFLPSPSPSPSTLSPWKKSERWQ